MQGLDTIMLIDLHNFFKFYDEKNPKHVAAVEQLEKDLQLKAQDLMQDDANWVRIYRSKEDKPQTSILQVPFYPQTDNYRDANALVTLLPVRCALSISNLVH
jgi:hypothetical protein